MRQNPMSQNKDKNSRFPDLKVMTLALATLFSGHAMMANAETPDETLPEVKVKASKQTERDLPEAYAGGQVARGARIGILGNQDMLDVPFSFTSYTSKTIEDQQARTLGDVLQNDPSVRTGQAFGTAAQTFVIRGYPLVSEDIAFNGLFGLLPRQLPTLENIERVDVFKGASAFLNGVAPSGSGIGGSINIVPKRAEDTPINRATVDYAQDGQLGAHADFGRRFGSDNQFGIRLNAVQREGNTSVQSEHNKLTFGSLGLDFRDENLRLSTDIGYQKQDISRPRLAVNMGGTDVPNAPKSDTNYSQPWTFTNVESTYAMFRGEYDFSRHLSAYAAVGASHNNELNDLVSLTVANNGSASGFRFANSYNVETVTGEAGLRGRFETGAVKHSVNLGATSTSSTARSDFIFDFTPINTSIYRPVAQPKPNGFGLDTGSLGDPDVTNRVRIKSVALSDTLSMLDDRLFVTLGLRRQSIQVINYDFNTGAESDHSDKSITTPIYGVVVKPWQHVSLYANHIEGLSQGPVAPLGSANFGQSLSPLRSKQDEVGVKVDMGRYGASAALFQIERPSTTLNAANVFTNDGEQRNRGIELNTFGEPLDGWRLLGGAAFTDAELTKTQGGLNDGNTSFGVPKHQYNLGTEYDIAALPGLTLTGRWIRTGAQYARQDNSISIPSWERFDLGARYRTKLNQHDVTLRANVENVFDKDYWAGVSPTFGQVTMGLPRTVRISATFDF
jgi:iron complex outermembrane receptor protein